MLRYKGGMETIMKYYFIIDVQRRLFGKNTTASSESWRIYLYGENKKCVKARLYFKQENNALLTRI